MPIDEQTRSFIEKSSAKPASPPDSMPLADFRGAVEAFRPLGFDPEAVRAVYEVQIPGHDGGAFSARIYVPEAEGPMPVVVWAHGGSWVRVTVDLLDGHFRFYANRGRVAVVAVDYSLSPEARFPVALEQIYAAGRWARSIADEAGWDPRRIGIAGESSGGNLAAAAALLDRDRGEVGFMHQALIVPVLDATFASRSWEELGRDYLLTRAQLEWAVEQYAPGIERTEPLLSPFHAPNLSGLPPTLIVTGEYDPLRDEGEQYAQRLQAAGVVVTYRRYEGLIHHALMVPRLITLGREMLEQTARRIGEALRSSGADETATINQRARA